MIGKTLLVFLLIFIGMSGFANVVDNHDMDSMVYKFLNSYNQLDGIELVGGPFSLEDYCVTTQTYIDCDDKKHSIVDYKYKNKTNNIKGYPQFFTVDYCDGYSSVCEIIGKNSSVFADIEKEALRQGVALKEVPFPTELLYKGFDFTIIQINNSEIRRKNEDISCLSEIRRTKEDEIQILYNNSYQSYFFRELVTINTGIVFYKNNNSWETPWKSKVDGLSSFSEENFILYGNVNDDDLRSLVNAYHRVNPGIRIVAIKMVGERGAIIQDGDLGKVTQWLKSRPIFMVVLKKNQNWVISNTLSIYNINNQSLNLPVILFPLHDSMDDNILHHVMEKTEINSKRNKTDILNIIRNICRFRGVGKNIEEIKELDSNIIRVYTDNSIKQQVFDFEQFNGKWLICAYSEALMCGGFPAGEDETGAGSVLEKQKD